MALPFKIIALALWFIALFVWEHLFPKDKTNLPPLAQRSSLGRYGKHLGFWLLNAGVSLAIILPFTGFVTDHAVFTRSGWMAASAFLVVDLVILDVWIYGWHRALHEIPWLWRWHEVHHLDETLDTTSALRFHSGEVLMGAVARAPLIILLAIPFSHIVVFETLVLMAAFFHHSNIKMGQKLEMALTKIIVTPAWHWVHHNRRSRADRDANYGTIFTFWDRIFRSKSPGKRRPSMEIGVDILRDTSFWRLLVRPFFKNSQK